MSLQGNYSGRGCRVYNNDGKFEGMPSVASIIDAIQEASRKKGWLYSLPAVFSVVVALIPVVICPACWPAYTALLAALGVPFFTLDAAWLLPVMFLLLFLTLVFLFYKAKTRRGYGPFSLGLFAVLLIVIGNSLHLFFFI
jgi:mercuric ion transport protein